MAVDWRYICLFTMLLSLFGEVRCRWFDCYVKTNETICNVINERYNKYSMRDDKKDSNLRNATLCSCCASKNGGGLVGFLLR